MHDEALSRAVKSAGESFAAPVPDVGAIVRRGRRHRRIAKPLALAAALALVAGVAVLVTREDAPDAPAPAAPRAMEWTPIAEAPIAGRTGALSVWTGEELIVWGGEGHADGASYDPKTDGWTTLPPSPLKTDSGHSAVWTGREMILWGGEGGDKSRRAPDWGAAYDPAARSWRLLPRPPYWSLAGHTAVWTGRQMIVWGGVTSGPESGAIYSPRSDRWRLVPQGPLDVRHGAEGVWAGDRMIVWGGQSQDGLPVTGGQGATFDPVSGVWAPTAEAPLEPTHASVSLWTGEEMIVAGGLGPATASRKGAAYEPIEGRWREIEDLPVPLTDLNTSAVWTGEEALFVTADGAFAYSPDDDRWESLGAPPDARVSGAVSAWTGDALIVWSGVTSDRRGYSRGGWIATE